MICTVYQHITITSFVARGYALLTRISFLQCFVSNLQCFVSNLQEVVMQSAFSGGGGGGEGVTIIPLGCHQVMFYSQAWRRLKILRQNG